MLELKKNDFTNTNNILFKTATKQNNQKDFTKNDTLELENFQIFL